MARVALVCMPFYKAEVPPISLGLLQAILREHQINSDLWHCNMWFAEEDFPAYQEINNEVFFHGEWIFSHALWGDDPPESEREVIETLKQMQARFCSDFISDFISDEEPLDDEALSDDEVQSWSDYGAKVFKYVQAVEPFLTHCLDSIDWSQYDVVGFTSTFQQNVASLALARRLKERHPHLYIIFGGGNCDGVMGRAMFEGFPFIDGVCTAEGDEVFPRLLKNLFSDAPPERIIGILDRRVTPKAPDPLQIVQDRTPPRPSFVALDELPYPDYGSFFTELKQRSFYDADVLVYFETSRGCWYGQKQHCTFCGVNGSAMDFRTKSSARALEEIKHIYERYGGEAKLLGATDNIMPANYPRDLLPQLAELKLDTEIFYETKSNLTKDQIALYQQAGVKQVQPGIESLNTRILKLMKKGVSGLQNVQTIKWSLQHDVNPKWNVLYGFPGELAEDYEGISETFQRLHHLPPPLSCVPIRIDRFSPYHERPDQYGITDLKAHPAYHLIYRELSPQLIEEIAYCFIGEWDAKHEAHRYGDEISAAVTQWQRAHHSSALVSLVDHRCIVIGDLRDPQAPQYEVITGLARQIYLSCDRIRSLSFLTRQLSELEGREVNADEVEALIAPLIAQALILREGDRFLSLAIPIEDLSPTGDSYLPPISCWPHLGRLLELMNEQSEPEPRRRESPDHGELQ